MDEQILVTRAAGSISAAIAERLVARGDCVIGIDNCNDYYPVSLKQARLACVWAADGGCSFNFRTVDFGRRHDLEQVLADCEFMQIAHLGAQRGVRYSLENAHAYAERNLIDHLNIL